MKNMYLLFKFVISNRTNTFDDPQEAIGEITLKSNCKLHNVCNYFQTHNFLFLFANTFIVCKCL